jgi:hypothetical protein
MQQGKSGSEVTASEGGAKRSLTVRLSVNGHEHIKQRARSADVDVSRMVRRMLAYAAENMPVCWVPPEATAAPRGEPAP